MGKYLYMIVDIYTKFYCTDWHDNSRSVVPVDHMSSRFVSLFPYNLLLLIRNIIPLLYGIIGNTVQ